jgi:hypothetical protein
MTMKRILAAALFSLTSLAFGATLNPVQLLNPSGSTAGQAVVSTGTSTPPAWGNVTATALAAQAANTVVANVTAASASPTAVALPSCGTANSALKYTSASGFSCGTAYALTSGTLAQFAATTSAQLAGVLSDETGSGAAVFGISPTITTPNIVGVSTSSNATAGSVGEYITGTASTVSLTSGTVTNVTSISLTAGDWDVTAVVRFNPAGTTTVTGVIGSINTTSATLGGLGNTSQILATLTTGQQQALALPTVRLSTAATTTVYCIAQAAFGTSTMTADCLIRARRPR